MYEHLPAFSFYVGLFHFGRNAEFYYCNSEKPFSAQVLLRHMQYVCLSKVQLPMLILHTLEGCGGLPDGMLPVH